MVHDVGRMDVSKDGKVCASDIDATLRSLGHTPGADEVSGMLWEVDDDTKGHLTAEDYHTSYYRIRESREQDEPRTWFRCVIPQCYETLRKTLCLQS